MSQPSDAIIQEIGAVCFHPALLHYLGTAEVEVNLAGVRLGARTIPAGAVFRYPVAGQLYRYALIAKGSSPRDAVFFEALLSVEPLPKRPKRVRRSG